MSRKGHIVSKSNRKTVGHKYRREKNGEQLKRSSSQTHEGTPRSDTTPVPKLATDAWLSSNHKNP
jgi:hypothetical protein